MGTAVLLEAMAERAKRRPFSRLVVASSMSLYGEGLYRAPDGTLVSDAERTARAARRRRLGDARRRGRVLEPLPTPETKRAVARQRLRAQQVRPGAAVPDGRRAYGIPTVALRFFNVFGTRQALSNPYTGVLAIFASRLLNDRRR
jgi:dTDP-L-rhamnose 4-epimerase